MRRLAEETRVSSDDEAPKLTIRELRDQTTWPYLREILNGILGEIERGPVPASLFPEEK